MTDTAINFSGKVQGGNLTSKPGHQFESDYWVEWDFDNWIGKQVRYLLSVGAKVVRIIGDTAMVQNNLITQALYNARMQQFVKYCIDAGLAVYYTGCATYGTNGGDNGTTAMTDAQIAAVINSNIGSITGVAGAPDYTSHLIAGDVVQEANANLNATRVNNLYSLIRPNVPSIIPLTFSTTAQVSDTTWIPSIIGSCDFLDYHIYPQNYSINTQPTPTDVTNGPLTAHPTKDVLFGEGGANSGGINTSYTPTEVANWLAGLATLGNMAAAHARGAMFWAAQDQDDQYGAFIANWSPRTAVARPWIRGQGGGTLTAPSGMQALAGALIWSPTGCSNAWDATRLYKNGAKIADQLHCLADIPDADTIGDIYTATAVAGASESAASANFAYPLGRRRRGGESRHR